MPTDYMIEDPRIRNYHLIDPQQAPVIGYCRGCRGGIERSDAVTYDAEGNMIHDDDFCRQEARERHEK